MCEKSLSPIAAKTSKRIPFFLSMVDFHTFDRLRVGRESRESKDFHERKAYSCQRVSFDELKRKKKTTPQETHLNG